MKTMELGLLTTLACMVSEVVATYPVHAPGYYPSRVAGYCPPQATGTYPPQAPGVINPLGLGEE